MTLNDKAAPRGPGEWYVKRTVSLVPVAADRRPPAHFPKEEVPDRFNIRAVGLARGRKE